MSNYPEESRNRFAKLILITTYLTVWAISLIVFWFFTSGSDAMGYSLMFLWILLPVTTLILSLLIGKNGYWGKRKYLATIAFGCMYMLAEYATFSIANMISFNKVNMPNFSMLITGIIISAIGMRIGVGSSRLKARSS